MSRPDLRFDGDAVIVHETHISWVFVTGDRAYKVKKPVRLPYLDYGTPARRRAMCRAEVELNRRLAPGIYLGVRALVPRADGGLRLGAADDPAAVDHAVEMRRFDERDTLAERLADGRAGAAEVRMLGRRLAGFHARAGAVIREDGAELVQRALDDDFATLAGQLPAPARSGLLAQQRLACELLAARRDELDARARSGRIRDGHGDLRLEHVVLEGRELSIVDCVEFADGLRRIDVAADLAFLVMDLRRAGRAELADVLVAAYRDAGGDPGDDALLALLAAYRAQVRAKVALTRGAPDEAGTHLALALRLQWRALAPLVLAVAGVAATGKSTLAAALAADSGFAAISSDVVRKRRAGLPAQARGEAALYDDAASRGTYAELGRRARAAAAGGAIVDATFRRRADRDAFRAALGPETRLLVVECRAPAATLLARARARERDPRRVSDADAAVVAAQIGAADPLDEIPAAAHLLLRSDRPVRELADEVTACCARRLAASPAR